MITNLASAFFFQLLRRNERSTEIKKKQTFFYDQGVVHVIMK